MWETQVQSLDWEDPLEKGMISPSSILAWRMKLSTSTKVNVGTLDHFTGMIGTGNVQMGGMTLSTGTVMALTTMAAEPAPRDSLHSP